MKRLRHLPIKRKLTAITMLASGIALLAACLAFFTFDQVTSRKRIVQDLFITARMIGANSAAGLTFDDPGSVEQALKSLSVQPSIVAACVYQKNGQPFALYQHSSPGSPFYPPPAERTGYRFAGDHLDLFQTVELAEDTAGVVYLRMNLNELTARIWRYLAIVALVLLVSSLIAFALSAALQRIISAPLTDLARTVTLVAAEKNYSLRAHKQGEDEIGRLIDGFNHMLAQIQERDNALQVAREHLEQRVEDRTKELAGSQALYHSLVEQLPVGVFRKNQEGRYVFVNSWFCRLKQVSANLFLGRTPREVAALEFEQGSARERYTTQMADQGTDHHQLILQTGKQIELEEQYLAAPGNEQFLHVIKSPVFGPDGTIVGSQGILLDITERKRAEAALAYERDLLTTLLENLPDTIYFKDLESRFVRVSRSKLQKSYAIALRRHRLARPEGAPEDLPPHLAGLGPFAAFLPGKSDFDFMSEECARGTFAAEQEIIRTGTPDIGKIEQTQRLDGKVEWVLSTKMPWRDKNGKIIGTFGSSKDITAIKEAEARLEEVHRQLLDSSRQAGMAEVATSVLHNVGNVLNSINTSASVMADLLRGSKAPGVAKMAALFEEHRADLPAFLTSANRGAQVVAYLKALAQHLAAEQGKVLQELHELTRNIEHVKEIVAMQQSYAKVGGVVEVHSVPVLLEDALRLHAGGLARHKVQVLRQFDNLPDVPIDKHKLLQILVNLISNAKYALANSNAPERRLTLGVRLQDHNRVCISVADNGIGIAPENLTRIFSHGFTTRHDGHGFGLHSGALAAREMGGTLQVASEGVGKGAVFTLELPLAAKPLPQ